MKAKHDGGPAFPTHGWAYGMSLRDRFAVQALMTLDVQAHVAPPAAEQLARSAYNIADAMLKAREDT